MISISSRFQNFHSVFLPGFKCRAFLYLKFIWHLRYPPPFLVTDTYTYFTPVICARFVCDLLGVCTRKFPAKPPKKPGHLSLTEGCISPIIVVYISCSYLLLSFCYYRLFIIIKTFWYNKFLCKIVFMCYGKWFYIDPLKNPPVHKFMYKYPFEGLICVNYFMNILKFI